MLTVKEALERVLTELGDDASVEDVAKLLLKLRERGELDPEASEELDRAQLAGVQEVVDKWLRSSRLTVKGVSCRRFVAMLDEQARHTWGRLVEVLEDPERRKLARAHSYSVLKEAAGMIHEHCKLLRLMDEPEKALYQYVLGQTGLKDIPCPHCGKLLGGE